jgi:flavin-dependent dehydrogenase
MHRREAAISLDEASRRTWDCVVIGAGPAGALAAHELARRGFAVLLADKEDFPRPKVCGCCLNVRALHILRATNLSAIFSAGPTVPLKRVQLTANGRQVSLPLPGGVALSRERLDAGLVLAAIEKGATFLPQTRVILDDRAGGSRRVLLRGRCAKAVAGARLVLAAGGLGGQWAGKSSGLTAIPEPAARIGMGTVLQSGSSFYGRGAIYMACARGGYVGLVRLEDGRLNVAAAIDTAWLRRSGSADRSIGQIIAAAGWPALPATAAWHGTPLLTRRVGVPAGERVFLLGDAAGYVEPFTGEGIAWAMETAVAVVPFAEAAIRCWNQGLIGRWKGVYDTRIGRSQRLCRLAAWALRRPALVGAIVGLLARAPRLALPILRRLNALVER